MKFTYIPWLDPRYSTTPHMIWGRYALAWLGLHFFAPYKGRFN